MITEVEASDGNIYKLSHFKVNMVKPAMFCYQIAGENYRAKGEIPMILTYYEHLNDLIESMKTDMKKVKRKLRNI